MNAIKTLAIASLVTFSTLAFTACDNKKAEGTTDADTTTVIIDETLIDETADDASNMMESQDSSMMNKTDSTSK